jgi:catechol 2,3-dioxygenase-like lactoylglutathione lyase family enzyme
VADLARSARWYADLLGLTPAREFVEDGVLRGVMLLHREAGFDISLRDRSVCAGRPDLAGFDVVAFRVASRADLDAFAEHCERLGVAHGEAHDRGVDGAAMDVPDPEGVVLRFVAPGDGAPPCRGLEFTPDGGVSTYETPRLRW